jgi:outer membrane receptor for ferrienterochelin and colicins
MKKIFYFLLSLFFILLCISIAYSQQPDTLKTQALEAVTVTATRTEKLLGAVPMPVTLISQQQIRQMGSLRLGDVLQEQTGLAIVNDHGQGLQMQGFSPDYTLILIDGEPLIGRTAGTMELSRVAIGNIKQIEIVKGPTSSLYGSEALAGVVNIITETPQNTSLRLSARYGANSTSDLGLSANLKYGRLGINAFANRYGSAGYDFTPEIFGRTVEPFHTYTFQSKIYYDFSEKVKLKISARHFNEQQAANFNLGTVAQPSLVGGQGTVKDWNFNPTLDWQVLSSLKVYFRYYYSQYATASDLRYLQDQKPYESTFFDQTFQRPEIQVVYFLGEKHIFTTGAGIVNESVAATRYQGRKAFHTKYVFGQYEFTPNNKLSLLLGSRYDQHSVYGSQFSPKLSVQYNITPQIALRGSTGVGFKAPDFRQLYLNFVNSVAGYSVFGTEELPLILAQLKAQNQISEVFVPASALGVLKAETSFAYNIGFKIKLNDALQWNVNVFRNNVSNLIESQVVAQRTNGQNIFSYRNLKSIFTQGIESDLSYQIQPNCSFSVGYQYMVAKDREVLRQIEAGELFRRNPQTLITEKLTLADYGGLMNRSRHMVNAKIFYQNASKGINASLRAIYRSRFGFGDTNGNLILDDDSEYIKGFITCNFAVSKAFWSEQIQLQMGIDNFLNYRNPSQQPNIAGRLWWLSLNVQLAKKSSL